VSEPRATNSQPADCAFANWYLNAIARGPMTSVVLVLGGAEPTTRRTRLFTSAQGSRSASGMESPAAAHEPCSAPAAPLCFGAGVAATADCGRASRVAGGAAWREQARSPHTTPTTDARRQSRAAYCNRRNDDNPEILGPQGSFIGVSCKRADAFSCAIVLASRSKCSRNCNHREVRRQDLDGDRAIEPHVARLVDVAHAARANQRHDFIIRDGAIAGDFSRLLLINAERFS